MKYEYFIASRYRNKDAVLKLASRLKDLGKSYYCFIESQASIKHVGTIDANPENSMANFEKISDWRNNPGVREVFDSDMNALKESEKIIVLLPAGKSVHIEAGVAYGLGKKLILIGEQKETESLYLIFNEFYSTIEDFIKSL
jgi:hypothetical protein